MNEKRITRDSIWTMITFLVIALLVICLFVYCKTPLGFNVIVLDNVFEYQELEEASGYCDVVPLSVEGVEVECVGKMYDEPTLVFVQIAHVSFHAVSNAHNTHSTTGLAGASCTPTTNARAEGSERPGASTISTQCSIPNQPWPRPLPQSKPSREIIPNRITQQSNTPTRGYTSRSSYMFCHIEIEEGTGEGNLNAIAGAREANTHVTCCPSHRKYLKSLTSAHCVHVGDTLSVLMEHQCSIGASRGECLMDGGCVDVSGGGRPGSGGIVAAPHPTLGRFTAHAAGLRAGWTNSSAHSKMIPMHPLAQYPLPSASCALNTLHRNPGLSI